MSGLFYIASLKHTNKHHEHITFYGPDSRGYTLVIGESIGKYTLQEAAKLNDGIDCLAIPVDDVHALLSPEPYYRHQSGAPHRVYDQRGPVLDNTKDIWAMLAMANSKAFTFETKSASIRSIKPDVFKGQRRSFAYSEPKKS
jgi:hypothetical protein